MQSAVDAEADNKRSDRAHSYTKYNNWNNVRGKKIISHNLYPDPTVISCSYFPLLQFQVQSWINSISSSNSDLISKQVIGSTYEGRPMTVLKVQDLSAVSVPRVEKFRISVYHRFTSKCF